MLKEEEAIRAKLALEARSKSTSWESRAPLTRLQACSLSLSLPRFEGACANGEGMSFHALCGGFRPLNVPQTLDNIS